jgi:DNA-binding response OmpR family regulator
MTRILVVEDEEHLAAGIRFNLEAEDYEVEMISEGTTAAERLTQTSNGGLDLVILDVMLPDMDGLEIARRARAAGNFTPILMLTARSQNQDVVEGLEAGADDYLAKPFDLTVLLARVNGLLRRRDWARNGDDAPECVTIGDVEVDFGAFEVRKGGEAVRLTVLETGLLRWLVQNAGRVVSKAEILENVWNVDPGTETRAIDNFILRLRRYIEPDPSAPRHLHTVRGAGYRLDI